MQNRYSNSFALLERARRSIPGGIWGHNGFPARIDPGHYPYFAEKGSKARFFDVDGNEFIDFVCGYGSMINGFACPEVDDAASKSERLGGCLNQPTLASIELAEYLCDTIQGAAWAAFAKNGSDATNMSLLIARAKTFRGKIVCMENAYHGSHTWTSWCNPGSGRLPEDSQAVLRVKWNDVSALQALFETHGNEIAAIMMTPFHHPIPGRAELPDPEFVKTIHSLRERWGSLLIIDDVRAGFRIDASGSHVAFGLEPDLVCFSKAIANTYPLAALTGKESLRDSASQIFASGTFWNSAPSIAAALVNLKLLKSRDGIGRMMRLGAKFRKGLIAAGQRQDYAVEITGPDSMPTMTISQDHDYTVMRQFCAEMAMRGTFLHPTHNWFLSAAHTDEDLDQALEHAEQSFRVIATRRKS